MCETCVEGYKVDKHYRCSTKTKIWVIIIVATGGVVVVAAVSIIVCCCCCKKRGPSQIKSGFRYLKDDRSLKESLKTVNDIEAGYKDNQ